MITYRDYIQWKDQPILHDEDEWHGEYKTFGDMWAGEKIPVQTHRISVRTIETARAALSDLKAYIDSADYDDGLDEAITAYWKLKNFVDITERVMSVDS